MQNHNDDTIKTSDTVLRKIYLTLYWKGCVWEGVEDGTELQRIDPHSYGHQRFFLVLLGCSTGGLGAQPLWDMFLNPASSPQFVWSPTAQSGAWGIPLLGPGFLYHILFPTDWISCAPSYIIVQRPPSSCGRHNFALIQLVHGQGYNILILIDWMHLLFTLVHFLFWQPGQVVG